MEKVVPFLLRLLAATAAVGTFLALIALALGALRLDGAALVLIIFLLALGVPSIAGMVILQIRTKMLVPMRDIKKVLVHGNPKWLYWLTHGLAGLGVVLWFTFAFLDKSIPTASKPGLLSGAFALFIFPAVYSHATSYLASRPKLFRKCSQGHSIPLDAEFCPTCGQRVAPVV